jgi:hypothetical protein
MSARVVLAVAVALATAPAWADDKVAPMGKVSVDSGRSSDSGTSFKVGGSDSSPNYAADHARSSSSGSRPSSAGRHSGGRSSGGGDRSYATPRTDAQRRHPRPGTGTGRFDNDGRGGHRYGYGDGGRYDYGYRYGYGWGGYGRYGYYYDPFDYWYSPYYYSGYYGYSPYYYRRGRGYGYGYRDTGSVRIIVDPERTRVYVDGYYAGIVDDFDGILQRLNVPPGRHEITLKLEGYRTQHFKVYVPVDDTIKIHFDMVRGAGEATSEEFAGRPGDDYGRIEDMNDRDRGDDRRDDRRYEPRDRRYEGRDDRDGASVRLQVSPRDASVYVDGEFRGSGRDASSLRLSPGRHRIEVVRPGFRTVEREIDVDEGRGADLQVELEKL